MEEIHAAHGQLERKEEIDERERRRIFRQMEEKDGAVGL